MLISKDREEKLKVIARKMQKMGFGKSDVLFRELLERYIGLELEKTLSKR